MLFSPEIAKLVTHKPGFSGVNHMSRTCLNMKSTQGHLGGSVVQRLHSAQGISPGLGIKSHTMLPPRSLLLPLPVSLPLSMSLMNKQNLKKRKKKEIYYEPKLIKDVYN